MERGVWASGPPGKSLILFVEAEESGEMKRGSLDLVLSLTGVSGFLIILLLGPAAFHLFPPESQLHTYRSLDI